MTHLTPTQKDAARQIIDKDEAIIDHKYDGNLLVIHSINDDHPEGADKIHARPEYEYMKTRHLGENGYGQAEFYLFFTVQDERA